MTREDQTDAGGLLGTLAGPIKEMVGSVLGSEDLRQEGQLHQQKAQAQIDATEADAAVQQLEAEQAVIYYMGVSAAYRMVGDGG